MQAGNFRQWWLPWRNGGSKSVGDIGSGAVTAETEGVSARRIHWWWAVERGSGDGKKSGATAEGTRTVVLAAATVAMTLADVIAKSGAGNGGRNRDISGATTINQNTAAAEAKTTVVAAGGSENRAVGGCRGGRGGGSGGLGGRGWGLVGRGQR